MGSNFENSNAAHAHFKKCIQKLSFQLSMILTHKQCQWSFSNVLTSQPHLHAAVSKRNFACRLNCNTSYCINGKKVSQSVTDSTLTSLDVRKKDKGDKVS